MSKNLVDRYFKLNFLKYVMRPAKKVENYDVIKVTELKVDHSFALIFKSYLNYAGFKSKYVDLFYGKMHYYDSHPQSVQRPLLFIHGLGCSAQNFWILGMMFSNKRRIILIDLFHMGGLSEPNNKTMNFKDQVASVVEFMQKITLSNMDICGSSFGGWIGLYLAAHHKNLVNKLILINPAGSQYKANELAQTILNLSWREFKFLYPGILKAFPYQGVPIFSAAARRGAYRNLKTKQVVDLIKNIKKEDTIENYLTDIDCPVLLLWGNDDQFISDLVPKMIMRNVKKITGKQIENCAHGPHLEAPSSCFKEMNKFLNLQNIKENKFTQLMLSFGKSHRVDEIEQIQNRYDDDN